MIFKKMPFGLSGASQTMAALMDKVLGSDLEPFVYFYLDDVIIATETFDDHIRVLKEVANRLKSANLSVNLKKSHFTKKSVKFLGYVLSEKGLTVDPEKVRAILSYAAPKNIRECRRLMGVAGWYQRFIKDFSLLTAPITELMKKNLGKFRWTITELKGELNNLKLFPTDIKKLLIKEPKYDIQCHYLLYFKKADKIKISDLREIRSLFQIIVKWANYVHRRRGPTQC
jgi:hypothetical protein